MQVLLRHHNMFLQNHEFSMQIFFCYEVICLMLAYIYYYHVRCTLMEANYKPHVYSVCSPNSKEIAFIRS